MNREKELSQKIIEQTILEMEGSLGKSGEVIDIIIETALENMNIRQTDDDKTFDLIDMQRFTKNIIQQCKNFISTMDYTELLQPTPLTEEVEEAISVLQELNGDGDLLEDVYGNPIDFKEYISTIKSHITHMQSISQEHLSKLQAYKDVVCEWKTISGDNFDYNQLKKLKQLSEGE